ncbi:MULE transposase domain [Sesbania bispinosa]|nr:MULE transposase domain [Sesbania bispinosa]
MNTTTATNGILTRTEERRGPRRFAATELRRRQSFSLRTEGYRLEKHLKRTDRKKEPRAMTRCGCDAFFRVRFLTDTGRWHVKALYDDHSHEMLAPHSVGMLPEHGKMDECELMQMNTMRDAGIGVTQIFGLAANQSGGYERLVFRNRDMYNEIDKQRRLLVSDVKAAFAYLRKLQSRDSNMFWRHTVDAEGRLEHLFWCDGTSQADYSVFGDVVAFDATYQRNKYMSPLVVFAGVNHHNQTIVFGSGLIANEIEETYVWLLKQFVEAMRGKIPSLVITEGDLAMRNAIRYEFPTAHHRLCAWHLLRNASSNISNPRFTSKFRWCMLGDYDVARFRSKWDELVSEFDLHGNQWVRDLYEKRKMWATAHIRGNFFAGFRTTSRCEGMHSQVGRYVHYRNNLTKFLKHLSRYLAYTRQREVEADFESIIGEPVLQTTFEAIERDAAKFYTRKVFLLFRPVLERACGLKVVSCEQTPNCLRYVVTSKRSRQARQWWTKNAKHCVGDTSAMGTSMTGSSWRSDVMSLLFDCYEVCKLVGRSGPNLDLSKEVVRELLRTQPVLGPKVVDHDIQMGVLKPLEEQHVVVSARDLTITKRLVLAEELKVMVEPRPLWKKVSLCSQVVEVEETYVIAMQTVIKVNYLL